MDIYKIDSGVKQSRIRESCMNIYKIVDFILNSEILYTGVHNLVKIQLIG